MSGGNDDGSHPIPHKDPQRHTNLKQSQPHSLLILPMLVDPNRIVNQQKDLTSPRDEPSPISCYFVRNKHKNKQRHLEHNQSYNCQHLRIEVLVQPTSKHAHNTDPQIDYAPQETQLSLVHVVVLLHGLSASR